MEYTDKQRFIDTELKQLWPKWEWTEATLRVWYAVLNDYSLENAQSAIEQVYSSGLRFQAQLVAEFKKKVKVLLAGTVKKESAKPILLYSLKRPNHRPVGFYIGGLGQTPPEDRIMREAEEMRAKSDFTYGDECVIIRNFDNERVPF